MLKKHLRQLNSGKNNNAERQMMLFVNNKQYGIAHENSISTTSTLTSFNNSRIWAHPSRNHQAEHQRRSENHHIPSWPHVDRLQVGKSHGDDHSESEDHGAAENRIWYRWQGSSDLADDTGKHHHHAGDLPRHAARHLRTLTDINSWNLQNNTIKIGLNATEHYFHNSKLIFLCLIFISNLRQPLNNHATDIIF